MHYKENLRFLKKKIQVRVEVCDNLGGGPHCRPVVFGLRKTGI